MDKIYEKNKEVLYTSIAFTITVFLFFYGSAFLDTGDFYYDAFLGEFLFIFLPPLLFVLAFIQSKRKKLLRINKISISNSFLSMGIILFSLPIVGVLNSLFYFVLTKIFGKVEMYAPPVPENKEELILSLIVVAVVPAICEEFLFRGLLQGVFKKYGAWFSIIITAILFSFLHLDFQKFFGILLLGSLIGFVVYRTNSLFAGIIAHFTNNAASVILTYITKDLDEIISETQTMTEENYSIVLEGSNLEIISTIFVMLMFLITLIFLMYLFIKNTNETVKKTKSKRPFKELYGMVAMVPAIFLFLYLYISQGFYILGKENHIIETIKNIIGFGY